VAFTEKLKDTEIIVLCLLWRFSAENLIIFPVNPCRSFRGSTMGKRQNGPSTSSGLTEIEEAMIHSRNGLDA
jgi:hypothetical protein